ncbi:MAG: DUF1700 domain-containing protein [Lachnospiraceae bacterium]|nr:DUF1700 domain-containing protein [Lachnospiraceae bacterium]
MKKEEFLKQLEYLLQDLPDSEKEEAISYYRDYLEEAGPEQEERAVEEFGSPERVAAIIRASASGNLEEGGAFTETGYRDERFKDPNFEVVERLDLPDEKEKTSEDGVGPDRGRSGYTGSGFKEFFNRNRQNRAAHETYQEEPYRERYTRSRNMRTVYTHEDKKPWTNRLLKLILIGLLLLAASPILLGGAGVLLGCGAGVIALAFGAVAVVLGLTIAAIIAGVILAVVGIVFTVGTPLDGIFLIGLAGIGIGCGLLGAVVLVGLWGVLRTLFILLGKGIKKCAEYARGKGKKTE